MFFLNKIFKFRDDHNPTAEKPFLEHLEDLRVMVTRVIVTLLVAMIACFALQERLMNILLDPVDEVWTSYQQKTLPRQVDLDDWDQARDVLNRSLVLAQGERDAFYQRFEPEVRELISAARLLRLAEALPEKERPAYLEEMAGGDADFAALLEELRDRGAQPDNQLDRKLSDMSSLQPTETFFLSMKLAFFAGLVVSFPFLLYYILQFVLPGLHQHEQKVLWPALAIGFGLFLMGVLFAYFIVLPKALEFFFEWGLRLGIQNDWRIGWYIGFATQFTLIFGLAFELPVVVMALVKIGLLSYETMSRTRRYAALGIVVTAAVISPTGDWITLSLMSAPMYVLYEICIWLAYLDWKKEQRAEEEERRERLERLMAEREQYEAEHGEPPHDEHPPHESLPADHPDHDPWHDADHEDPHHDPYHDPDHDLHEGMDDVPHDPLPDEPPHPDPYQDPNYDLHQGMQDIGEYDHDPVDDPLSDDPPADPEHPPLDKDGYIIDPQDPPKPQEPGETRDDEHGKDDDDDGDHPDGPEDEPKKPDQP